MHSARRGLNPVRFLHCWLPALVKACVLALTRNRQFLAMIPTDDLVQSVTYDCPANYLLAYALSHAFPTDQVRRLRI